MMNQRRISMALILTIRLALSSLWRVSAGAFLVGLRSTNNHGRSRLNILPILPIHHQQQQHYSALSATARYSLTTIPSVPATKSYRLVIVESPSKCNTISKILDQFVKDHSLDYSYVVTSCMGHLRNLPTSQPKDQPKQPVVGIDIHNGYTPTYVILPGKEGLVKELQALASTADQVVIATDEDREGEAIGWHLQELLPSTVPQVRVTFGEITKSAIYASIQNPHALDMDLVQAQETRRILDRLAGYTVSPVLWKKIAPGLSAGRVQSVGMAIIVQRERERLKHIPVEYWDLQLVLENNVTANIHSVQGQLVASGADFDNAGNLSSTNKIHLDEVAAQNLVDAMKEGNFTISRIVSKERRQSPPLPFTTSTLQQEGNKRLGMSVSQIMSTAQKLYESGYISYMRTDSSHLSQEAQQATITSIVRSFGTDLVGDGPGASKKSKNAQEAHEAIRPAIQEDGSFLDPSIISVTDVQLTLYKFIWERTVASRMTSQVVNSTSVDIRGVSADGSIALNFRVSGSVVQEPGYTLAWDKSSTDVILPTWEEGKELELKDLLANSHVTQPPPRFNEASFVKALEELGVGRPSTYAGVVQTLRDRAYVGSPVKGESSGIRRQKVVSGPAISAQRAAGGEDFVGGGRGPLVPSLSAFVVCSLLENHCSSYVDPLFTATMEERLDEIACGQVGAERVKYLDEFYAGKDGLAAKVLAIDETVDPNEARRAHLPALLKTGNGIGLFIGPWGPYVQKLPIGSADVEKFLTAPLPAGMASNLSTITTASLEALLSSREKDGIVLGTHPADNREIKLKIGRYGAFLQWGQSGDERTTTHSLPKHLGSMRNLDFDTSTGEFLSLNDMIGLSLEDAVGYLGLPRTVCTLNDLPIVAAIGPYGPYLKYNNSFVSLGKADGDVLTIDDHAAIKVVTDGIINKASKLGRGVLAELGEMSGSMVTIKDGRFGMYISWKRINAKMPAEYLDNPSGLPLDDAWTLLEGKGAGSQKEETKKRSSKASISNWDLPPAPKKPKSAYLHFCADRRPEVTATATTLGEVSKELARLWAETENDYGARQPYDDLAAKEKEAYEEKKKQWRDECQNIMDSLPVSPHSTKTASGNRAKGVMGSNASFDLPKRGLSSYLFFCAEKRSEVSQRIKSLGDVSKELARLWSETHDRSKYDALSAADAIRYKESMLHLNNDHRSSTITKKLKASIENPSKLTKETLPPKRVPSGYMLFCSDYRRTIVDADGNKLPFGETTKRLAELWRECDPVIKAKYYALSEDEKEMKAKAK